MTQSVTVQTTRELMTGNEAIARGAFEAGVTVATGYPGTPSTEILEAAATYKPGIYCEWSPNEKVALEVAIGASLTGARSIVTMKHVGLNVAADPLLTFAYIGAVGGLVVCVADDPGMHSSQKRAGYPPLRAAGQDPHFRAVRLAGSQGFHAVGARGFRDTPDAGHSARHHAGVPFAEPGEAGRTPPRAAKNRFREEPAPFCADPDVGAG